MWQHSDNVTSMKHRDYGQRICACGLFGLSAGVVLSVWIVVLTVLNGSLTLRVRGHEISAVGTVALYLAGGLLAGVIVGIGFPLLRWAIGAAVLGVIAAVPFAIGIQVLRSGFIIDSTSALSAAIFAVVFGGVLGPAFRELLYSPIHEVQTKGRNESNP